MNKQFPQLLLSEQMHHFIKASCSGKRLNPSGKRITKGTITNYQYALDLLLEYEERYSVKVRILLLHRASVRIMQKEKNYWARFFTRFSNFLFKEKGYYDCYVNNIFKILKTCFIYLQTERAYVVGNFYKSFRIPRCQSTPVVLTPEKLRFLITDDAFNQSLRPSLQKTRDIFIFGCTVALRYSDLMSLRRSNLIQTGTETFLCIYTQKTGTEVRIPLPSYAVGIIDKYKSKTSGYLLPRLACANLNKQLKKLAKAAGWDYTLPKFISHRGKMMELKSKSGDTWKYYEHITAHTMRRTAITTLLILGVPEPVVRKISGHTPGSLEFYKYVSIAQEYLGAEVKKAYQKLLEDPTIDPIQNSK